MNCSRSQHRDPRQRLRTSAAGGDPLDPEVCDQGCGLATGDTTIVAGASELVVVHRVGTTAELEGADVLTATWEGQAEAAVLAAARYGR